MADIEYASWDDDIKNEAAKKEGGSTKNFDNKTEFLKMDEEGDYKIRLVGPYVKCRKHFTPYRATVQDSEKSIDPAWLAGFYPNERFAINVIDRADGKIKVLEKGNSVFKHFINYKKVFGKAPNGKDGTDWLITVSIPVIDGKKNKFKTEYTVTRLDPTPFTAEEMDKIVDKDKIDPETKKPTSKLWPLKKIFRSTPAEAMKKMWDELPADKKIAPKKDYKGAEKKASTPVVETGAEPIEENMDSSPADNGNDMFGDTKKGATNEVAKDVSSAELF